MIEEQGYNLFPQGPVMLVEDVRAACWWWRPRLKECGLDEVQRAGRVGTKVNDAEDSA